MTALQELDFEALESGAVYDDGFTAESPTIRMFWEVLHTFTEVGSRSQRLACGTWRSQH